MFPHIAHLYGPVWIQSYGFMIAVGLLVFLYFSIRHPMRERYISKEIYINGVFFCLLCGVFGGRMLYALSYPAEFIGAWQEFFYPWVGGLTVLGAIIGVLIGGSCYLSWHHVPLLPVLDLAALYAPCMQAIARLGCFAAGCCYGMPLVGHWWAVTFTHPSAHAPLFISLHPAQLYASAASAVVFLVLWFLQKRLFKTPGLLLGLFLLLENVARFIVDFWRGDREPFVGVIFSVPISQVQLYALVSLIGVGMFIWWRLVFPKNKA
jgi:phosphatidylglycerol:prolipoprotein diacylglycerol transferase